MALKKYSKTKEQILAHTKAKLNMYKQYLEIYISIMSNTPFKVSLFDPFCGKGIYRDGEKGSPLIAYEIIKSCVIKNRAKFINNAEKQFSLILNDKSKSRINNVEQILETKQIEDKICEISYSNKSYLEVIDTLIHKLRAQSAKHYRNLLFIDPYGYKDIRRFHIESILALKTTEIMLFLPMSFIYRFLHVSFEDLENPNYVKIRNFVRYFFSDVDSLLRSTQNVNELIKTLRKELTFDDKYFCCSYLIKRDHANTYALFFITPHILGCEKILEAQWKCDVVKGEGFDFQSDQMIPFLLEYEKKENHERFKKELIRFLSIYRSNNDVHLYTLRNQFLPKHANCILKALQKKDLLEVIELKTGKEARKGSFYINYTNFRDKNNKVKIKYVG